MFYYLFELLESKYDLPGAGLFQFISFRAAMAVILSLIISILFGNKIIYFLQRKQIGEEVRNLGLEGQIEKRGTPTMGGVIIILAILVPTLLMADLTNIYIWLMIITTLWLGAIGFADDYIKVFKKNKKGLHGRFKIYGQLGLGLIVGLTMIFHPNVLVRVDQDKAISEEYNIQKTVEYQIKGEVKQYAYIKSLLTNVPFLKDNELNYTYFSKSNDLIAFIIFMSMVMLIITSVSNGANLTDGLDGLLAGLAAIIGVVLGVFAYVSGNSLTSDYLNILFIPNCSELVIFAACFIGSCIGFLWFNSYPARVFMGDTGSLALGGIIASLAILLRKELLIPIMCGIFLVENLSVIMQVSYFKYTKRKYGEGRRIFLMSPLHHHYQKKGIHEVKIVTRFWIVGIMLAVLTIITLKIR